MNVIKHFCNNNQPIKVTYPTGITVNLGNALSPTEVKFEPKLQWEAKTNIYYTLVMVDPDSPSRRDPKFREWNHWLVGNIPGNSIDLGDVLVDYIGSGPPKETGLHRYVFIVFKQTEKISFDEVHISKK